MLGYHASYSKASCDFFFLNPTDPIYQETHSTLNEKKEPMAQEAFLARQNPSFIFALTTSTKKKKPLAHRVTNDTLNKSVNVYSLYITKKTKKTIKTQVLSFTFGRVPRDFIPTYRFSTMSILPTPWRPLVQEITKYMQQRKNIEMQAKTHPRHAIKESHIHRIMHSLKSHNYLVTHPKLKLLKVNKFTYHSNQNKLRFWIKTRQIRCRTVLKFCEESYIYITSNSLLLTPLCWDKYKCRVVYHEQFHRWDYEPLQEHLQEEKKTLIKKLPCLKRTVKPPMVNLAFNYNRRKCMQKLLHRQFSILSCKGEL